MKITSVFLTFICSLSFAYSQSINLDDVRSLLDGVIKNKKNKKIEWSGVPGDTNFNIADRIAILDVINAYGVYWDENNLKGFFNLFLDDAVRITTDKNGNEKKITKSEEKKIAIERQTFFKKNSMQRRHMMHNTHFIKQTENYARVIQYMTLLNTTESEKSNIVSPIIYDFEFYKINDIWKISKRKLNLDYKLDLPFKK
tara:strand:+ start:1372 stop:1968 length:597 start_codon:yes stop_codon:yes gene_type:complete